MPDGLICLANSAAAMAPKVSSTKAAEKSPSSAAKTGNTTAQAPRRRRCGPGARRSLISPHSTARIAAPMAISSMNGQSP